MSEGVRGAPQASVPQETGLVPGVAVDAPAVLPEELTRPQDRPPVYRTTTCRSCPARIIWVSIAGDRVPVDAEPVAINGGAGTILLDPPVNIQIVRGRVVRNQSELFGKRWVYRSHHDTCPYAARHRRRPARPSGRS